MDPSSTIRGAIQQGVNKQNAQIMTKQRDVQRIIRGNNRYTTYHAYRQNGNKDWKAFKNGN